MGAGVLVGGVPSFFISWIRDPAIRLPGRFHAAILSSPPWSPKPALWPVARSPEPVARSPEPGI